MGQMKSIDAVYHAYLLTYEDLFCLSKNIDVKGKSTIKPQLIDEDYVIQDEVLFAGDSEQYFSMTLKTNNYFRYFEVCVKVPIKKVGREELLGFANSINLEVMAPASVCLSNDANEFLIQSRTHLSGYGLVQENNDEPDNHSGFFYAVETTKKQILAVGRLSSVVVRELESLGWIASS